MLEEGGNMSRNLRSSLVYAASAVGLFAAPALHAQGTADPTLVPGPQTALSRCDFSEVPGAVWWGPEGRMTIGRLAAYVAPVYWFSPDEPLLGGAEGRAIRLPEALPFETDPDAPVVYYQIEEIVGDKRGYIRDSVNPDSSIIDLEYVGAIKLSFFAYFRSEEGLGAHPHDVEATEFKIAVPRSTGDVIREYTDAQCEEPNYVVVVTRVSAKAHGIKWFWNVVDVDADTRFPMSLLVEEGKHGLATDKNGDGYFTPGYDVTRHINDAWGVRDVIRGGTLFTGGYQAWMTKVRQDEHRVFPPLPEDSPLYRELERRGYNEAEYAMYELRPFPPAELAADDPGLYNFMEDKEVPGWPEVTEASEFKEFADWVDAESAVKSLAISLYTDGDLGFAWAFPFFIVKNFEVSLSGGFIVWRMYVKDTDLRDFGWMAMYTPSASRWIDTYLAAGAEWDAEVIDGEETTDVNFVLETGLKFRVNVTTSMFRFLSVFTDFWGFRAGIKNYGFSDIDRLTYVFEVGAGAF